MVAANGHGTVAVQQCVNEFQAAQFILKHHRRTIRVALSDVKAGAEIHQKKLPPFTVSRYVALAIPDTPAKMAQVEGMLPPSVWLRNLGDKRRDIPRQLVAAWRFDRRFDLPSYLATRKAIIEFAKRIDSENAHPRPDLMPVPFLGNWKREDLLYDRDTRLPVLEHAGKGIKSAPVAKVVATKAVNERRFVRGDEEDDEAEVPDLKEDWIAGENFTYFVGLPKQGKSLGVAKMAAYITAGGTWDSDGKWSDVWFDGQPIDAHARGSVIICEQEDKVSQTKARCRSAGCVMSKVIVRKFLPDISVADQLKEVTDVAEQLGDCRMISFSPLQAAVKSKDNAEPAVREKFDRILSWVEGRGIALIGVLHLTKDGKALSGSDVLFRVARCVVLFDGGVMSVRDSNIGPTGMQIPFSVEKVVSKGVKTARINFGPPLPEVHRPTGSTNSLSSEYGQTVEQPCRKYNQNVHRYAAALQTIFTPGGQPITGVEVRKVIMAPPYNLTWGQSVYDAADALGIRRGDKVGWTGTKDWTPPSEWPDAFDA